MPSTTENTTVQLLAKALAHLRKRWVLSVTLGGGAGLVLVIGLYVLSHLAQMRCLLVAYSALEEVSPGVYVDPQMAASERQTLLQALDQAQARLRFFFDSLESRPTIIVGTSPQVMRRYGSPLIPPGMNHATPFGSYIVLGPGGLNADVICHELCHAELLARIGWYARRHQVPTWFDEGLALMFDYRYASSHTLWSWLTDGGKNAPPLSQLDTMDEFLAVSQRSPYLSYVTAMKEVFRWMSIVGRPGLDELLARLRAGEGFAAVYQELEQRGTPSHLRRMEYLDSLRHAQPPIAADSLTTGHPALPFP